MGGTRSRDRGADGPGGEHWVFGYGSLVWRPGFPHVESAPAHVRGYSRRFWQGSPDHRGVPQAPGRVVTLVPEPGAVCWGVVYRIAPADWETVLRDLDVREIGGFARRTVSVAFGDGRPAATALTWVAGEGNPNYLGSAPLEDIADQIRRCGGRSGSNVEYALRLAAWLRANDARDDHVLAVAELVAGQCSSAAE
jgi:cation transport regulator ChaC